MVSQIVYKTLVYRTIKISMRNQPTKSNSKTQAKTPSIKFTQHFKSIHYYSMPTSVLYTFRKRVHFFGYFFLLLWAIVFTIL